MKCTTVCAIRAVRMYMPMQASASPSSSSVEGSRETPEATASSNDVRTARRITEAILRTRESRNKPQQLQPENPFAPLPIPPPSNSTSSYAAGQTTRDFSRLAGAGDGQEALRLAISYGKSALLTHLAHQHDDTARQRPYAYSEVDWARVMGEEPVGVAPESPAAFRVHRNSVYPSTAEEGAVALSKEVEQTWVVLENDVKVRWITSTPQGRGALRQAMATATTAAAAPAETPRVLSMDGMLSKYPDGLIRPRRPRTAALSPAPSQHLLHDLFSEETQEHRQDHGKLMASRQQSESVLHDTSPHNANRASLRIKVDVARAIEREKVWLENLASCLGGDNAVKFVNDVKSLQRPREESGEYEARSTNGSGGGSAGMATVSTQTTTIGALDNNVSVAGNSEPTYSAGVLELCEELGIRSPRRAYVLSRVLRHVDEAATSPEPIPLSQVRELTTQYAAEYDKEIETIVKNAQASGDVAPEKAVRDFEKYVLELAVDRVQVKLSKFQDDVPMLRNCTSVFNNNAGLMATRAARTPPPARNGVANGETQDEILKSLNHIEDILNRGQHVLYDDNAEGGEPADAGAVAAPVAPAHRDSIQSYQSYHSTPQKPSAVTPDYQRSPAAHPPVPPRRGNARAEPQTMTSPYQAAHDAPHRRPSGSATRTRTAPAQHSSTRRVSRAKSEEELSASARARQIQEIKRESGRVPNFEEGVDDSDTAQNTSLDELKERIRRELEEYHRNGPLMHRRASYQRKQRAATVPRTSAARRSTTVKPASAGGASRALPPPRAATTTSSKVKTPKRLAPPPPAATQYAAVPRSSQTRSATPTAGGRAAQKKTSVPSSSAKPRAKTVGPPPSRPARTSTAGTSAGKPFWERLYRDAAVQQEKRDQRAEQLRIEREAERVKAQPRRRVHRPPAHTAYSAYYRNLQSNAESTSQSRELSANRARTGGNVPAQHASYLPKRTTAAPAAAKVSAAKPPVSPNPSTGAPAHVAARRPSAQPAPRKPAGASTPPVPLPLGPGPRAAAAEGDARRDAAPPKMPTPEAEMEEQVPPVAAEERATPSPDRSRDCTREPFGEEPASRGQSEEDVDAGRDAGPVRARHSDSDSDSATESDTGLQKNTPHPYVSPLDLRGIKK